MIMLSKGGFHMNILILTGKFGMGHVKCAEAIYKGFSLLVTKLPGMYNHLNHAAGKHAGVPMKRTIASKLDNLMA